MIADMLAVDDGLFEGNFNLADIAFLIALIAAGFSAVFFFAAQPPMQRWAHGLLAFAVASIAFGFLVL